MLGLASDLDSDPVFRDLHNYLNMDVLNHSGQTHQEYKSITKMRLAYITRSAANPSHFTLLVRSIPWCQGESYSATMGKYFTNYYPSSYHSYQMVYHSGIVQKLMGDAGKMCKMLKVASVEKPSVQPCCFCGGVNSFKRVPSQLECVQDGVGYASMDGSMREDLSTSMLRKVLKQVEIIKGSRSSLLNFESHEVGAIDLQVVVDQYLQVRGIVKTARNAKARFGVNKEASESTTKAWLEKMRTLFIRKSCEFSFRSAIMGDAYKQVNEIGIPYEIAQRITFEERVNNVKYLQQLVDNKQCFTYKDGSNTFSLRDSSKSHTCLQHLRCEFF